MRNRKCGVGFFLQGGDRSSCTQLSLKPPLFSIKHWSSILFYVDEKVRNYSYTLRLNNIIKNSTISPIVL